MLRCCVKPKVLDLPGFLISQQDDARAHWAIRVQKYLD